MNQKAPLLATPMVDASRTRADRIVAIGRAALAAAALFAIWLDPAQPTRHKELTYALLAGYTAYALIVAALAWRRAMPAERWVLGRHVLDLSVFAALMYPTEGPTSPFFVLLTFAMLSGTLLWQEWGAVLTGIACLLILAGFGATAALGAVDMELEITRTVIRGVYLGVAALTLAALGLHQTRVRAELWRLAEQPIGSATGPGWPIREALAYAAGVLRVPRALLVWSEADEPWTWLTSWQAGRVHQERVPPEPPILWTAELPRQGFFSLDAASPGGAIVHRGKGRFERQRGESPIGAELRAKFGINSVVAVPVPTDHLQAWLFLLDGPRFTADDLLTAEVAAGRIAALFEQASLLRELREAAQAAERVRIARDLHDGVLQSLAGTALQLRALAPLVRSDPERTTQRLADLQEMLVREQRELRALIGALGPGSQPVPASGGVPLGFAARLGEVAAHLERQWEIAVRWQLAPEDTRIEAAIAAELLWIVREAVANAARHGGAKSVTVELEARTDDILVAIEDDGCGFPFAGRLDGEALRTQGSGPRSLRERVEARHGQLVVDSCPGRTRLEAVLPRSPEVWA
jgi:signal transduction histidine kinase